MSRCCNMVFNRGGSPKGNMWSVIPVVLLCAIVNWSERKKGSGPEEDDWETFVCLSICPSVRPSVVLGSLRRELWQYRA